MRHLLIGDPHFKKSNSDELDRFTKSVFSFLDNEEIDSIIVLGDILDTHEKINMQAMIRATKFLLGLSEYCTTYVLVGNHDRANNGVFLTEEHSLYPLKFTELEIIDKPRKIGKTLLVPYVEPGRFLDAMSTIGIGKEELENGSIDTIFCHQEFKGAQMGGLVSLMGDEWKDNWPRVYSGHIHDYQQLGKVTYIGTPYQTGFGDNPNKGIYILEDHTLTKVDLGMIPKIVKHVSIKDVLDLKFDKDKKTKLIIEGDASEIRKMVKEKEYRRKLKDIPFAIKDISQVKFPEQSFDQKRVFTIPKIIEIVKENCDLIEKEILENVFPTKQV